jgi:hypothetical protein
VRVEQGRSTVKLGLTWHLPCLIWTIMNRPLLAVLFLGATLGTAVGCDNSPNRQRQEANEAIADADKKVGDAEADARKARMEADKKIAEARKEAADEMNEAQRKLVDDRSDFRGEVHKRVAAIDRRIEDLKVQSTRTAGKIKDDVDQTLTDARARRSAIEGEMRSFEASTDQEAKSMRSRVDNELDELESLLRRGTLR